MIEILHEYWKPLLWTDGYRFTGVAITLWLLILSVVIGGVMALFLAIGRVSSNKYIQFPIWLFTYIFRGTPLYVQLLVFYSGMYTLEIVKGTEFLNAFFRSGLNCTVLALTLNTCAYTTEIFAGAIQDYGLGSIVGTTTYGKGIVQQIFDLGDGTCVKLTMAEYYTPNGRNIHKKGITPDVEVEYQQDENDPNADNQLDAALEQVRNKINQ